MKALAALLAGLIATGATAEERWHFVASRTVQYSADSDLIPLRGFSRSRQFRLCASGGPVELLAADFRFADGRRRSWPLRGMLRSGHCTRAIAVAHGSRELVALGLFCQRQNIRDPARIRVEAR